MLYLIRAVLIISYFLLFGLIANFCALFRPFHRNNTHRILKLFKPAQWIANLPVHTTFHSEPPEKPVIYIANHQDLLDIFRFFNDWPENTVVVGKRSLLLLPFFGTAYWLAGNVLINRNNKESAWNLIDHLAANIHDEQHSILFFPEGTRNQGKGLLPFKLGAFHIAIEAKVDIIPVCASSTGLVNLNKWRPNPIAVEFLAPISTEGLTKADAGELANRCHHLMTETISRLDTQIAGETHDQ